MLWMMLLCALPLVILLLAGGKLFSAGYLWLILIGVFVVAHFWMMFRGHRSDNSEHDGHNSEAENKETPPVAANDTQNEHKKHGGCCHH